MPSDAAAGDHFGNSVSVSGDVALSSSTYETPGTRVLFDNLVIREP